MKFIALITSLFILLSCSSETKQHKSIDSKKRSLKGVDSSYFVLQDVRNIDFVSDLNWDFDKLYWKKSENKKFRRLNDEEKIKFLSQFVALDEEWIKGDLDAYIVAQQNKIGTVQPTIIKVYGTDYAGLVLVNLDENENVVSGFPIYSLEISGYQTEEDTLIVTRPKVSCTFIGNKFNITESTGRCKPVEGEIQTFTVDESRFTVTIDQNGKIIKTKPLRSQFIKKCKLGYFQTY